jgi:hypothetical protein
MKPFKIIKESKNVVNDLKRELPYSRDKVRDAKRINTLIDCIKSFENIFTYEYKTDALDTLIYSLIYEYFSMHDVYNDKIPLYSTVNNIDFALVNGSEQKKLEIISLLKSHEIQNKIKDNSILDGKFTNFDELLTDLANQFKQTIKYGI